MLSLKRKDLKTQLWAVPISPNYREETDMFKKTTKFNITEIVVLRLLIFGVVGFFVIGQVKMSAQDLPPTIANLQTIPAGSMVIPMDNTNQALVAPFNLKSYGLVDKLLQNGIPVMWAIKSGKGIDGVDFSGTAKRVYPTATTAAAINFAGGPFIVHRDYVASATTILSTFANNVAVYQLTVNATVDIRYNLTFKPRIAVGSTNATIHTDLFDFALIPEYTSVTDTTLNSSSCYSLVTQPHTSSVTAIPNIKSYVQSGGNFLAECLALFTYENDAAGRFMTTTGVTINNVSTTFTYPNADLAFSQFVGTVAPAPGGSEQDWLLSTGSVFQNSGYVVLNNSGADTNKYAATVSKLYAGGNGGLTYYLGGHNYGAGGTTLDLINGQRMILNTVFVPGTRPGCPGLLFPKVIGYKSVRLTGDADGSGTPTAGDTLTWTVTYINTGSADVNNFQVGDVLPGGMRISATGAQTVSVSGTGTTAAANTNYTGATAALGDLLGSGAILAAGGKISINIPAKINPSFVGTLSNQTTATGVGLPVAGVVSDNVDSATAALLGNAAVAPNSLVQTQSASTLDPTTVAVFAPTAAAVSISGRVLTSTGRGIASARVILVDSAGVQLVTQTNPFGYYRFLDVPAGQTIIVAVSSKRYQFINPTRAVSINEAIDDLNFTAAIF